MDRVKAMIDFPAYHPAAVEMFAYDHAGQTRAFVTYLEVVEGEILQRVFAFCKRKKEGVLCTEVQRRMSGETTYIYRNMYLTPMSGWTVFWENKDILEEGCNGNQDYKFSDSKEWVIADDDNQHFYSDILNPDALEDSKYKHCGYRTGCLIHYLNAYAENQKVEYFGRLGIEPSRALVDKAGKDRNFCAFLRRNVQGIESWGAQAAIYAYNHGVEIREAHSILYNRKALGRMFGNYVPEVRDTKISRERLYQYLQGLDKNSKHVSCGTYSMYNDYLKAIKYLHLDLADTKNTYPKDFRRMHDQRIAEYASAKAKDDREEMSRLEAKFQKACNRARIYEKEGEDFCALLPVKIKDLKIEGSALHHCVGRMGYDAKVANGQSLIVFIRRSSDKKRPYVTVEYSLKRNKVLQAYGDHDTAPDDQTMAFVKAWEEEVKQAREKKRKKEAQI